MLASVRDADEAALALDAGADIIDLKDPSSGALGALAIDIIHGVVAAVKGRTPVSATIGDVPFTSEVIQGRIESVSATGVDLVKVGVFGEPADDVLQLLHAMSLNGLRIVLVFFAEDPFHETDFEVLSRHGVHGVMLDTRDKHSGSLRSKLSGQQLGLFVSRARHAGLLCGLAGSLALEDIPALLPLQPDYLGFRGALCNGSHRSHRLDGPAIGQLRRAMLLPLTDKQPDFCNMQ